MTTIKHLKVLSVAKFLSGVHLTLQIFPFPLTLLQRNLEIVESNGHSSKGKVFLKDRQAEGLWALWSCGVSMTSVCHYEPLHLAPWI